MFEEDRNLFKAKMFSADNSMITIMQTHASVIINADKDRALDAVLTNINGEIADVVRFHPTD